MTTQTAHHMNPDTARSRRLRVRGLVQGVGFRPLVWRLAHRLELRGNVRNDGEGVLIQLEASDVALNAFVSLLREECPPLARIDSIEVSDSNEAVTGAEFSIVESKRSQAATGVPADAATCADCLRELNDPADRRYRYPFLNCTHCGPRISIIRHIPYDRANTSMAGFMLCDDCLAEYMDPADRRFHAQPTACPVCGPKAWLCNSKGEIMVSSDPVAAAAAYIKQGAIVAIKGIGGVHLACDARNAEAVATLRTRKQRPHKPLAMMARDLEQLRSYCRVSDIEAEALCSTAAPIVILDALDANRLPDAIAPGQAQWGFMLPYSPLHHLLMAELDSPVVLTSGNRSEEPQCIDNADALDRLGDIADVFLLHDRPIENRIDDSVVRQLRGQLHVMRRARGYAPGHIALPEGFADHPPLLALGGELKNTFCLLQNGHAILSQHMGDLEDARTFDDYRKNLGLYLELYAHRPQLLALDQHPEYLSTKLGYEWADEHQLGITPVQHHHAHIAACMADNDIGLNAGAVIGVAFDGLGFGDDGTLWGGEFLLAEYTAYKRLAHLKPVVMPGGAQAMREPWRNTWAQLAAAFGWEAFSRHYAALPLCDRLNAMPVKTLQQMADSHINSPLASSAGRLFDAVAAAVGIAPAQCSYEGQAAMLLEASFEPALLQQVAPYPFEISKHADGYVLDPAPMWTALLDDLAVATDTAVIAARFHRGLAQIVIDTATMLADAHALERVALSGGVFQNRRLCELVVDGLERSGLQVLTHRQLPANDGGIALGQAMVAAAREITRIHSE